MQEHKELILRSNHSLGALWVKKGLISQNDFEAANEKSIAEIQSGEFNNASILKTLIHDLKTLDESKLLDFGVEEYDFGLIDLTRIKLQSLRHINVDFSLCWATLTIPFDLVEGTHFVATCHYMSEPVVEHWNNILDCNIIWYGTTFSSMHHGLETVKEVHAKEDEVTVEEEV